MRRSIYVTVLAGLGLLAFGFLARGHADGLGFAGTMNHGASVRQTPGGAPAAALGRFEVGTGYQWQLDATLGLSVAQSAGPEPVRISARLRQTPTDVEGQSVLVRTALEGARVEMHQAGADDVASGAQAAAEGLARALSAPFYARYDGDGRLLEFWFPAGTKKAVTDVVGTLLTSAQLVNAEATPSVQRELDTNGTYLAAYARGDAGELLKRKVSYLEEPGRNGAVPPSPTVDKSEVQFELLPSGWPKTVRASEQLGISLADQIKFKSLFSFTLGDARRVSEPGLAGSFRRAREEQRLLKRQLGAPALAADGAFDEEARRILGRDTLATLTRVLDGTDLGKLEQKTRSELGGRFRALFRLDAAAVARAPELVKKTSSERAKLIVSALAMADTEATSTCLLSLVRDSGLEPGLRVSAIHGLTRATQLPPATGTALIELARAAPHELSVEALLAAGSVVYHERSVAPERTGALVTFLLGELERATDRDGRRAALIALGNAGSQASLPALEHILRGDDAELSAFALSALRRIEGKQANDLLRAGLNDAVAAKRRAAIGAVGRRELGPLLEDLVALAERDADDDIRAAATQTLGKRLASFPTLRAVLEGRARSDRSETVRKHARRLLGLG